LECPATSTSETGAFYSLSFVTRGRVCVEQPMIAHACAEGTAAVFRKGWWCRARRASPPDQRLRVSLTRALHSAHSSHEPLKERPKRTPFRVLNINKATLATEPVLEALCCCAAAGRQADETGGGALPLEHTDTQVFARVSTPVGPAGKPVAFDAKICAMQCSMLQRSTTCCNSVQHVSTQYNMAHAWYNWPPRRARLDRATLTECVCCTLIRTPLHRIPLYAPRRHRLVRCRAEATDLCRQH
jgi:hypothetical protein